MKLSINKNGITLKDVSVEQLAVVEHILNVAKERCFHDVHWDEIRQKYDDGGDFCTSLTSDERNALHDFVWEFELESQALLKKIQESNVLTPKKQ